MGNTTDSLNGLVVRQGNGLGGKAMAMGRPAWVSNYPCSAAISHDYDKPVGREGLLSIVAVPIVVRRRVRGVIYGALREPLGLTDRVVSAAVQVARDLHGMGYSVAATKGTAAAISQAGVPVKMVNKVKDGRPHIADLVKAGDVQLVFTTVDETRTAIADSRYIRTAALAHRVTYYTTMAGCEAATEAMKHRDGLEVVSLQELHAQLH